MSENELPFHLRGNYRPVTAEVEEFDLCVTGKVPPALSGLYVRNGPNPVSGRSSHWFVGDGMVHGVRLENGRAAWYRNRWVRTRQFEDPTLRSISPDGSVDRSVGVNNTHVIGHAGRILTLVESSFPVELDHQLDTVGVHDFDGALTTAMTAHPKICPLTGELLFFGYGFAEPYLTYHRVDASGALVQSEEIPVAGPTMIHDFAITESSVVFFDLPVVFDIEMAMTGRFPYRWDDDYGARVGVMPRDATAAELRWFEIEPCYVFHSVNAYDDADGSVVVDVARYPELWRRDSARFTNDASLWRWHLGADGAVTEEQFDDRPLEFPRIDDALTGAQHRFSYSVASFGDDNDILKADHQTGSVSVHSFGADRIPGEPVFVASPDAVSEDDGWLLTYVYDKGRDSSDLVVLDARDMSAEPVAVVALPQRVPFGFHGSWVPDQD